MAKDSNVSAVRKAKNGTLLTIFFTLLSIVWVSPIFIVLINSFKKKTFINKEPFKYSLEWIKGLSDDQWAMEREIVQN